MLIKPVISEKSMQLAKMGQFSFAVLKNATKTQIKSAAEKLFNIKVLKVRTSKNKAVLTLPAGQKI